MEEEVLRCASRMHGVLQEGVLEVKCKSKHCGSSSKVNVFHYFDIITGQLIHTKRYKEPIGGFTKEEVNDVQSAHSNPVRSSAGDDLPAHG